MAEQTIDLAGMVECGALDVDTLSDNAAWLVVDTIAGYVACCYGDQGDEPGQCEVVLEAAECYGVTVYRWADRDDSGTHATGSPTLDKDEAEEDGAEVAEENDETPDKDEQIRAILDAGWFSDAVDADDIRAIVEYCHSHNDLGQGHVIIDRDGRREWVATGYVEHEAMYLSIPHGGQPWSAYAVDILRGTEPSEEDDQ
jgi:hypothetical protein